MTSTKRVVPFCKREAVIRVWEEWSQEQASQTPSYHGGAKVRMTECQDFRLEIVEAQVAIEPLKPTEL